MKTIKPGHYYLDSRKVLRKVDAVFNACIAPGVSFEVLSGPNYGQKKVEPIHWFNKHAQTELDPAQGDLLATSLRAEHILKKMSDRMKEFLLTFDNDCTTAMSIECMRDELRTALFAGCSGILVFDEEANRDDSSFEVRLTDIGIKCIELLHAQKPSNRYPPRGYQLIAFPSTDQVLSTDMIWIEESSSWGLASDDAIGRDISCMMPVARKYS